MTEVSKAAIGSMRCKPVPEQNYHLTLAFLGNAPREAIPNIIAAARGMHFEAFTLRLDGFACWSRSQIAWLGPQQCPKALKCLVNNLWTALEPLGFKPNPRPFVPHVSIARRVSGATDVHLETETIEWTVDDFVLVKSKTLPTGAVYTPLEHFPAAG